MEFGDVISKALPLMNPTKLFLYTFPDLLKPGPQDVLQSTLPFYELAFIMIAFVVWIVVFVYYYKLIYFPVGDPYATPHGPSLPYERKLVDSFTADTIMSYIYKFTDSLKS